MSADGIASVRTERGVPRAWPRHVAVWAIAIVAIAFVAWVVPIRDRCTATGCEAGLITTMRTTNSAALIGLFAVYLLGTLAWAARWRALLGIANVRLSLMQVWRVTLEAQAGGIVLPGGVAGDALRFAYAKGAAPNADLAKIAASIMADRVVGLVTLAGLATAAALGFGADRLGAALPVLAAIPVASIIGWLVLRRPELARARFVQRGIGARVIKPLLEYASAKGGGLVLVRGLVLSLLVSGVQLLVVRGLVAAMSVQPTHEAWMYVGTTLGMIVAAVPALPGAWGTADAAYIFFLGRAGVPAPAAAAACLLYRVFWYACGVLGALLALARRTK
ncbi:MAG: flippase-like domain-containing protein [Polyangiaceae bacterium]|nr:flippase-like domain-containing protein [Polyangiaceae bacterium]